MSVAAVALFAQALGIGAQAYGQYKESKSAAQAEAYNAAVARQQAEAAGKSAELELWRARKRAESFLGTQRSSYAKAGVRSDFGSPLEVMADSAAELEMDALITNYNIKTQQNQYLSQAALSDWSSKNFKMMSMLRPITTLLTGAGDIATKISAGSAKGYQSKYGTGAGQRAPADYYKGRT